MPAPGARVLWNALFNKPRSTVPRQPLPVLSPSRAELDATVDGSLFRLGHSTLLLKLAGSWWLTDPVFSERASPLPFAGPKRFHAPPVALADLPPIRGVILSHDHYDHLDRAAIKALVPLVELFLAPLGVGDRLLAWGVPPGKVRQLDWWQGIEAGGLRLTATPAQHFSGRGLHDGNRTLWCSWVIESVELKLFFSGDSGYFDGFAEIGRRYGPFDLTMLETGAYNEHWPYVHMHPQQTLQAHRDLGGRWLLPIHNGTFDLAMHLVRAVRTDTRTGHRTRRTGFHADDGRTDRSASTACRPTLVARSGRQRNAGAELRLLQKLGRRAIARGLQTEAAMESLRNA